MLAVVVAAERALRYRFLSYLKGLEILQKFADILSHPHRVASLYTAVGVF
jgi:hypothetical protein